MNDVKTKAQNKNYFTKDTENAIILYNNSSDFKEKSKLFEEKIYYALYKLAENLIHTFKFYYTEVENLDDLKHEIITVLIEEKLHMYKPKISVNNKFREYLGEKYNDGFLNFVKDKIFFDQTDIENYIKTLDTWNIKNKINYPKAYSYFGTIVKNWLIIYNEKNYKKLLEKSSLEDLKSSESYSYSLEDQKYKGDKLSKFVDSYVEYCTKNIYTLFPPERYIIPADESSKIADAILEIFRKRENIDVFNKKALYIYIREMVDVKTPKITKVAAKLKDIFKKNYSFYLENGYIDFDH